MMPKTKIFFFENKKKENVNYIIDKNEFGRTKKKNYPEKKQK